MKLLLAFLLGTVVLGLVTDRLDGRTYGLMLAGSLFTTALFFTFQRFWL